MTETDTEDRATDDSAAGDRDADERPPEDGADADDRSPDERADIDGRSLGTGVVTIATDRSLESDPAGEAIVTALKKADHEVVTREHIGSDHDRVQSIVSRMLDRDDVDLVVTGGATGVEPSDVTIEAVEPLLDKRLTAFSELFTTIAYEAVGTTVIGARTIAGVTEGNPVFCLPGNEDAARLGLEEIVLPEIHNLVSLAREDIAQDRWAADEPVGQGETEADLEASSDGAATETDEEAEIATETDDGGGE